MAVPGANFGGKCVGSNGLRGDQIEVFKISNIPLEMVITQ